jgi:hypothetical protein
VPAPSFCGPTASSLPCARSETPCCLLTGSLTAFRLLCACNNPFWVAAAARVYTYSWAGALTVALGGDTRMRPSVALSLANESCYYSSRATSHCVYGRGVCAGG